MGGHTYNELFEEQLEVLARQHRLSTDKKLFGDTDKAVKERNFRAVFVCAGDAWQYATVILASAVAEAEGWVRTFNVPQAKEVLSGRQKQHREVAGFFAAVERCIATGQQDQSSDSNKEQDQSSDSNKETFAMGAWRGFFDGLRASRYNAELTKSTMKLGKAFEAATVPCRPLPTSRALRSDSNASCRTSAHARQKDNKKKQQKKLVSDGSGKSRQG
jgi:hypothetical protein